MYKKINEDNQTFYRNNNPAQLAQNRLAWNATRKQNTPKREVEFLLGRVGYCKNEKDKKALYDEIMTIIGKAQANDELSDYMASHLRNATDKAFGANLSEANELEKRAKAHKATDKKGAKGWFVNPNPGDPKAIKNFNDSVKPGASAPTGPSTSTASASTASSAGASGGMGEQFEDDKVSDYFMSYLDEDIVKDGSGWTNKGKEGTHGKFKTKKAARKQQKAMFANGYKG